MNLKPNTKKTIRRHIPHAIAVLSTSALAGMIAYNRSTNLLCISDEFIDLLKDQGGSVIYKVGDETLKLTHVAE